VVKGFIWQIMSRQSVSGPGKVGASLVDNYLQTVSLRQESLDTLDAEAFRLLDQ
jgi:hypothetical protein